MTPAWAAGAACLTALLAGATSELAHCDLAVVGAGAGGALAAWRAAEAGRQVCVFELRGRPGGRIHSLRKRGTKHDLVVEAGAYRFAPQPVCDPVADSWCIFTPITTAVVEALGLRMGVYDPNPKNWDHKMHKIVDADGEDLGYLTMVETMLQRATEKGARVFFNTEVTSLNAIKKNTAVYLSFARGGGVSASTVLFNVPQNPLLRLLRHSGPPFGTAFSAPLHDPTTYSLMKLYVHYEDAWWRNYLGLTAGSFQNQNDGTAQSPAPLQGQYHDGHVRCDGPKGQCRGFLQAYYSPEALAFFRAFHPQDGESAVELSISGSAEERELLTMVHLALVELHRKALDSVGMTEYVVKMLPDSGVLSIWSDVVTGIEAGCHEPKAGTHPSPEDLPAKALQPFEGWPVYVADEAFGPISCWAEGSLNMSISALEAMGVQRPPWLNESFVGQHLMAPPPPSDPFFLSMKHVGTGAGPVWAQPSLVV